ncbi:phage related protein (plasmid) [Selenomonas ruminantium subsp. lactilytica TAM6421]|uniref:Phage related protein n=1 Tax=Selenomonas ruminantium subsp. lactilytica (strain NBRC 103574 / TAM6421) TaxID=927704 RepID=I0GWR2_SELRL|nr:phage head closure protein [Selenomonas ruminantium]BAL85199.1 phage related protein [Selenomonas ruminantium subsp. lactilytica TAM6421]
MILNPGLLNKKVDVWGAKSAEKGGFDSTKPVKLYSRISAAIQPVRGSQFFISQLTANKENVKITIRYRRGITESCTVTYHNHVYDVQSIVDPDMAHESLELYCVEQVVGNTPAETPQQKIDEGGWEP